MSKSDLNISSAIQSALESAEVVVTKGVSAAQLYDLDPQKIEAFYALGYRSYMQRDYQKAEEIFTFAYCFDHRHAEIVKGLASARKMQGKFKEALPAYAQAALLDMEDPAISFHAGECLFALGEYAPCADALSAARTLAEMRGDCEQLIGKIDQMEIQLQKQQKEDKDVKSNDA